jgi:hypothetical protein
VKKFFGITIPVLAATLVAAVALVEAWVRVTWDPARGRPGLFVSDPVRLDKLAPKYDGWFAGVPVRTNALGFRDNRNYQLEKRPGTFRILVLGDSVTFGHGSVYEHTYPLLLEQRLKAWKPSVDWQVWNLGVPGYNTSQELAYLLEVGSAYRPDLVVVGFFGNDFSDNHDVVSPTRRAVVASAVTTWFKRHMYSFDLYRKVGVTLRYRLRASQVERSVLENMAEQDRMLAKPSEVAQLHAQQLTDPAPLSEEERAKTPCPRTHGGWPITLPQLRILLQTPESAFWKRAVARLQRFNRDGSYRMVFFVNAAPPTCSNADMFDAPSTSAVDEYVVQLLSDGAPAVSSYHAIGRYRPSQMPEAAGHSLGNSNAVKATVLFEFLRDRVLPALPG